MIRIALVLALALVAGCQSTAAAAPPPGEVAHQVTLGVASFAPRGAAFFGSSWRLDAGGELYVPIAVDVGCTIAGWSLGVQHNVAASQLTAALQYVEPLSSAVHVVGGEQSALGLGGNATLTDPAVAHVVAPKADYSIRIARDYVAGSDYIFAGELTYTCPAP